MKKILVIEDDGEVQKVYKDLFDEEGYVTIPAYTAPKGLELAASEKPDLIILDIMLPGGKNGFDVLEEIKGTEDLKKIPVLVLTNMDSERNVALMIGATDYMVKSDTAIDELKEKVKKLLSA